MLAKIDGDYQGDRKTTESRTKVEHTDATRPHAPARESKISHFV